MPAVLRAPAPYGSTPLLAIDFDVAPDPIVLPGVGAHAMAVLIRANG